MPCGINILQTSATVLNFSKWAFCHVSPLVWSILPQFVISGITVTTNTFKNRRKWALYSRAFLLWHVTLPHLRFFAYSEWQRVSKPYSIIIIMADGSPCHLATTVKFIFFFSMFQLSCNDLIALCCMTVFVLKTSRTDGHSSLVYVFNFLTPSGI